MKPSIFDDPKVVERWCGEQRAYVENYLRHERVEHGPVAQTPAWHVAPYLSIWMVESAQKPGQVGWWVVCGDVPADYVSAEYVGSPREAMRTFAARWKRLSASMRQGKPHPEFNIGTPGEWPKLGKLLDTRADLLAKWADDDSAWDK
jgi:hypothetical protein